MVEWISLNETHFCCWFIHRVFTIKRRPRRRLCLLSCIHIYFTHVYLVGGTVSTDDRFGCYAHNKEVRVCVYIYIACWIIYLHVYIVYVSDVGGLFEFFFSFFFFYNLNMRKIVHSILSLCLALAFGSQKKKENWQMGFLDLFRVPGWTQNL